MELTTLLQTLFEAGGWTLLIFGLLIYALRFAYIKLSKQFETLNNKVDSLKEEVSNLKIENTRFDTLMSALVECDSENCPNAHLIKKIKKEEK